MVKISEECKEYGRLSIYSSRTEAEARKRHVDLKTDHQAYGVELTPQEKAILRLPPKYSLYRRLDSKDFENQLERMNYKLRYSVGRDGGDAEDPDSPSKLDAPEPVINKSGEKPDPARD